MSFGTRSTEFSNLGAQQIGNPVIVVCLLLYGFGIGHQKFCCFGDPHNFCGVDFNGTGNLGGAILQVCHYLFQVGSLCCNTRTAITESSSKKGNTRPKSSLLINVVLSFSFRFMSSPGVLDLLFSAGNHLCVFCLPSLSERFCRKNH